MSGPTVEIPQRDDVLARARKGQGVAIVGRHGKSRLMLALAEDLPKAVLVRVPKGPDQIPYVLLQAAAACGPAQLRDVAACLARSVDAAVAKLDLVLAGRPLLVDDADAIGVRGVDPELRHALEASIRCVRGFVERRARVMSMTAESSKLDAFTVIRPTPDATTSVKIWNLVGCDIDAFELALLRDRLVAADPDVDERSWESGDLVADIWDALPEAIQEVVGVLAVHGRPIPRPDLDALGVLDPANVEVACALGVVTRMGESVWLPKPWYEHCPVVGSRTRSRALHARLAQAFAGQALGADAYLAKPLFVLEAHRHFAAVPDIERARQFAHFGAATLLDTARRLSIAGRDDERLYAEAAKTYDVVLQLEAQATATGGTLGKPVVGYATHYKHYNRYKASMESRVETMAGYKDALSHWPGNALFRSRMIVALFLDDRYADAQAQIAEAYTVVPPHLKRDAVLRGRSADKLLHRERVEPAFLVWDDYQPDEWGRLSETKLFDRLKRGFETDRLRSFRDCLVLVEPTHVRFSRTTTSWIAQALDTAGHGAFPAAAYGNLIEALREETRRLHRTLLHNLSASDRMRKQRLLGMVDLAASKLLELGDGTTWVYGRLVEAESGGIEFLTHDGDTFALEASLKPAATGESAYRLARVKTGSAGQPVGPIVDLEAPVGEDPASAFERWRERLANDG